MNRLTIGGRVGQVAPLKEIGQTKVCEFSVATTESIKVNNQWTQETEWHNCKAWGKMAELASKLAKGEYVIIQSKKKTENYTNKQGQKISKVVAVVEHIERPNGNGNSKPQYHNDTQNLSPQELEPQDGDMPF